MLRDNLHQHKFDECFKRNLSDCEVGLNLVNIIIDCLTCTTFEPFHLAFNGTSRLFLSRFEGRIIDDELAFALSVDFLVMLAFVRMFVKIAGKTTWR